MSKLRCILPGAELSPQLNLVFLNRRKRNVAGVPHARNSPAYVFYYYCYCYSVDGTDNERFRLLYAIGARRASHSHAVSWRSSRQTRKISGAGDESGQL